jgi:hypothetical protein
MPNIKGLSDTNGNITITKLDDTKVNLLRTDLIKLTADINTGASIKTNTDFDTYTHCYEDLTKVNPKRTATLVCNKGYIPPKNWWVNEDIKPVVEVIK